MHFMLSSGTAVAIETWESHAHKTAAATETEHDEMG